MSEPYEFEQKHLDNVLEKIQDAKVANELERKNADKKRADVDDGWNDVRYRSSTYSGLFETAMSVRQQQQMLEQREAEMNSVEHQAQVLERLRERPYFARIDVQDDGTDGAEPIYIGLASFSDAPDHFLVYDWRAPISSIYYDEGVGDVTYTTPDGPQQATVHLKRQFQIEDDKVVTIFDTDEAVGDQMLLDALSGESTTKMQSIVTTIQREQNKIIRNTAADLLFVQGAAGSGKTSAVLQRVAYLLYRYRGQLTAGQVVMFSPNQLFNDYIDQVLPELGEQNMVQMTYYQYASRRLPRFNLETLQERFEGQPDTDQKHLINYKGSLDYFNLMQAYAKSLNQSGIQVRPIKFRGQEIISADKIKEIYYSFNENYNLGNRLFGTKERLLKMLQSQVRTEMKAEWVDEQIENLSKEEYDSLMGDEEKEFKSDEDEHNYVAKIIVTNEMRPLIKGINRNRFININRQFVHFLKSVPMRTQLADYQLTDAQWDEGVERTVAQMREGRLSLSDMTPFMLLFDLIKGAHGERDIRFLFIDEIQDYTPFQLAFLKYSFPKARFTMLGDLNQAIFTKENAVGLQADLQHLFNPEKSEYIELTDTYRSTQQITDFAKAILVDGATINAFEREGAKPVVKVTGSDAEMVDIAKERVEKNIADHETTAIITKTLAQAEAAYAHLRSEIDLTIIRTENQRLVPGTIIVPAYLAKGLEFDAVIMWDATEENYHDEDERQLVYTIASRAMHQLTILANHQLSPLLADIDESLYVKG